MSTPYDPGRPEDRPSDQPGFPPAPPPQPQGQPPQGGGYAGGPPSGEFPPAPGYGNTPQQGNDPQYGGGPQYGNAPQYGDAPQYGQAPQYGNAPQYGQAPQYGNAPQYGQAPQYGNAPQYGSAPQYADPYGTPTPASPPKEVLRAVQLMFVRVAIGVLSALLTFAAADSIKDSIRESDPSLTADEVNAAYAVGVGVAIFFGLVFAALYVLLALQVRKGKNWARIVTWVLASLGVLSGLLGLLGPGTGLEKLLAVLLLVIDAGIIVLLALKPSNEYFAARKAPRY